MSYAFNLLEYRNWKSFFFFPRPFHICSNFVRMFEMSLVNFYLIFVTATSICDNLWHYSVHKLEQSIVFGEILRVSIQLLLLLVALEFIMCIVWIGVQPATHAHTNIHHENTWNLNKNSKRMNNDVEYKQRTHNKMYKFQIKRTTFRTKLHAF